jgi:hypothetical protein
VLYTILTALALCFWPPLLNAFSDQIIPDEILPHVNNKIVVAFAGLVYAYSALVTYLLYDMFKREHTRGLAQLQSIQLLTSNSTTKVLDEEV